MMVRCNIIEQFCRDFFKGGNKQLHDIINCYEDKYAMIDIQQMNLTQETFDTSFKLLCRELFNARPTQNNAYIIALLGFAIKLNEYHLLYCSWYQVDILIDSLVAVLEDINFDPKELNKPATYCIIF